MTISKGVADDAMLDRLREGKVIQIAPQGVSMLPFIRGGCDKVLLRKTEHVDVGNIVLVEYRGRLILHRVYAVKGSVLTLMGDGNLHGTEQVDVDKVLATAVGVVKPGGRCRKPHKAWLWRHTLAMRKWLLKVDRKWNKWCDKQ